MSETSTKEADNDSFKEPKSYSILLFEMCDQKYRTFIHLLVLYRHSIKREIEDPNEMKWNRREFEYIMRLSYGAQYNKHTSRYVWNQMKKYYERILIQDLNKVRGSANMLEALNYIFAPANQYVYSLYKTFCQNLVALRNLDFPMMRSYWDALTNFFTNFNPSTSSIPDRILELGLPQPQYTKQIYDVFNRSLKTNQEVVKMMFAHYFQGKPYIMPPYTPPRETIVIPNDLESRDDESEDEISEEERDICKKQSELIFFMENDLVHGVFSVFEMCRDYSSAHEEIVESMVQFLQDGGLDIISKLPLNDCNKARDTSAVAITTAASSTDTVTTPSDFNIDTSTSSSTIYTGANSDNPMVESIMVFSPNTSFVTTTKDKYGQTTWQESSSRSMRCREEDSISLTSEIASPTRQYSEVGVRKWEPVQETISEGSLAWRDQDLREARRPELLVTHKYAVEELPTRCEGHHGKVKLVKEVGVYTSEESLTNRERSVGSRVKPHEQKVIEHKVDVTEGLLIQGERHYAEAMIEPQAYEVRQLPACRKVNHDYVVREQQGMTPAESTIRKEKHAIMGEIQQEKSNVAVNLCRREQDHKLIAREQQAGIGIDLSLRGERHREVVKEQQFGSAEASQVFEEPSLSLKIPSPKKLARGHPEQLMAMHTGNQCTVMTEISPSLLEPHPRMEAVTQQQYPLAIVRPLQYWSILHPLKVRKQHPIRQFSSYNGPRTDLPEEPDQPPDEDLD